MQDGVCASDLPMTGTPVFLGVRGIDCVMRLDGWHVAIEPLRKADGMTPSAVMGFFANGGRRCYLVPADGAPSCRQVERALAGLDGTEAFDLVCAAELGCLPVPELARAHAAILAWCARSGRHFAILDAPRSSDDHARYRQALDAALQGQAPDAASFGAAYHPWLQVVGATDRLLAPPSGHIAGIYSRTDRNMGVWSAPANADVVGAVALDGTDGLASTPTCRSAAGLNAIRSFRKRGIRAWGANTLSGNPAFAHVTTRRTLQAVMRRMEHVLTPIVFEPNTPLLWLRITRIASAQLDDLHRSGALAGNTPGEAYFVRCDATNNSPGAQAQGQVVAEAGIAVVAPAQFITINIRMGEGDLAILHHTRG